MKRGDIYYIAHRNTVGSEMAKGRPAVIVSADALNDTAEVVEVVFLTTKPKKEMPTHVGINSTRLPSTACCEQITTVSEALVGDYFGRCTDEEMADIDRALMASLDLGSLEEYIRNAFQGETAPRRPNAMRTTYGLPTLRANDPVDHPSHYTDGRIEVIDYIEDKKLGYHLGNAVKYISRAGKKDPAKTVEDLKKARWYIDREIERLEAAEG
jgi:mRNA interferase MazF